MAPSELLFCLQYPRCPPFWLKLHGGAMTFTGNHWFEWAMDLTLSSEGVSSSRSPSACLSLSLCPMLFFLFYPFLMFGQEFKSKRHMYHIGVFLFRRTLTRKGRGLAEAASKAHKSLAATWYLNFSESARSSRLFQTLQKTVS